MDHPDDGSRHPQEIDPLPRPLDPVGSNAACRQLKVRSDYLRGLLDGLGIEPVRVRQPPVLSPEQFDQVQARVEGVRAARTK
jgi:hypothetical protein